MALYDDNLFTMRAAVRGVKPNVSPEMVNRWINKRIRLALTSHYWSDLTRFGFLAVPDSYTTGVVSVTPNSPLVSGAGTGWPVTDAVNTTAGPDQVRQPGYQAIHAGSMAGITIGTWLLIEGGGTNQEAVAVVDVAPTYFVANFQRTHDPGFAITKSSLAGRQFRTTYPFFTVTAVLSATSLLLDIPWSGPSQTSVAYQIQQVYFQPDPYCWRIDYAWDPVQGIALDVESTSFQDLTILDPQMTTTDNPTVLSPAPPGGGGVPQWFLYPPQSSQRQIGIVYFALWPKLVADTDRPPPFINPEVFVAGATADALRTRNLTNDMRQDPYFDTTLAQVYEEQYREYLDQAQNADEPRRATRLQGYRRVVAGAYSASYLQSHPGVWPSDFSLYQ